MPYLMIKVLTMLTNNIVSFEQLGPDFQLVNSGWFSVFCCLIYPKYLYTFILPFLFAHVILNKHITILGVSGAFI